MKHCRWLVRNALFCLVATLVAGSGLAQQGARLRPAVRVDPIEAILDAFGTHNVVALGEPHGNEQAHAFRVSLIRDPRFAATVNDIVVECGNARYHLFVRCGRTPQWQTLYGIDPSTKNSFERCAR